jgi:hypothetical protein
LPFPLLSRAVLPLVSSRCHEPATEEELEVVLRATLPEAEAVCEGTLRAAMNSTIAAPIRATRVIHIARPDLPFPDRWCS